MPGHGEGERGDTRCARATHTSPGAWEAALPRCSPFALLRRRRRKRASAAKQCSKPACFLRLCAGRGCGPSPTGHSQQVIFKPPARSPAWCTARDPQPHRGLWLAPLPGAAVLPATASDPAAPPAPPCPRAGPPSPPGMRKGVRGCRGGGGGPAWACLQRVVLLRGGSARAAPATPASCPPSSRHR